MTEMTPAEAIFFAAAALPAADRANYLERACAGNDDLRRMVERMLAARPEVGDFLELPLASPAASGTGTFAPDAPPADAASTASFSGRDEKVGSILAGKYKLIEEIGEGGMGSVYMAQQTEPVKRAVAVKVIKAGMDSKAVLARFEAERQALAMMDHPNIAKVLDAGTTESGRPFFVMELVKGMPITEYCDAHKLTPRQRLELFVPVCLAIQHAHQKGVIHRDIKPSNVIVAMYDDRPVPKVIDFGVAKAAGQSLTDKTLMTGFGAVVGTPEYMSPEQANLNNLDIDTRSDVYSLGVLLYELLTGTTPVDRKSLGKAALLEVLRIVREVEAPKPSAMLSSIDTLPSVAANRGTEPAKLSKLMKGELDWVLLKALEKDRTRRYETANALARDLQRYLADEVVEARPQSAGYRLRKFVRRHKGQVLAASLVLLALLGGIVGTTLGLIEARQQEQEAKKQEQIARDETAEKETARAEEAKRVTERDQALETATGALAREAQRVKERDEALKLEAQRVKERDDALKLEAQRVKERDTANDELSYRLAIGNMLLANAAFDARDVRLAIERLELIPPEQRGWDWYYLKMQTRGGLFTIRGHRGAVTGVMFSPDGTRILSAGGNQNDPGESRVWDARTGEPLLELKGLPQVVGGGSAVRTMGLPLVHNGSFPITNATYSPDGTRVITPGLNQTARVCDSRTGEVLLELKGHATTVISMAFSPDGTRIVTGGDAQRRPAGFRDIQGPGEVKVWDAQTGKELFELKGHKAGVVRVEFSPDGKRIATVCGDLNARPEMYVWNAEKGGPALLDLHTITGDDNTVAFSPDSTWIVTGGSDGTATVIDAQTGKVLLKLKGRTRPGQTTFRTSRGVLSAAFSPDGTRIVTAGGIDDMGEATVWDARTGVALFDLRGHSGLVMSARFSPDGARIVTGGLDGTIKLWDARPGTPRIELEWQRGAVNDVAISRDGTRIVTAGRERGKPGVVTVWDARTGMVLRELKGVKGTVVCMSMSRDGTRIITAGGAPFAPGEATVWDADTGTALFDLKGFKDRVCSVSFSPDGNSIVTGEGTHELSLGGVKVFDARTGKPLLDVCERGNGSLLSDGRTGDYACFSPDSTRIVIGGYRSQQSAGGSVKVVDARTGKTLSEWHAHMAVQCLAYSPDGKWIVTGGSDGAVRVWDAQKAGPALAEMKGGSGDVNGVCFSPDGKRVISGGADKTVRVWDTRTGTMLAQLHGHASAVSNVVFSADGTRIVSSGHTGTGARGEVFIWHTWPESPQPELKGPTPICTAFSPDGTRLAATGRDGSLTMWDTQTRVSLFELKGLGGEVRSLSFTPDGTRIVTRTFEGVTKVWETTTGKELRNESISATVNSSPVSPDGRFFAHMVKTGVELIPLKPDGAEREYRLLITRPDPRRNPEGYLAARTAGDKFVADFYLGLVPVADRTALVAKAEVAALAGLSKRAEDYLRTGKREQAVPLLVEIVNVKTAALGPDNPDTLQAINRLGVVYWQMRQFDKSVPLFEDLVKRHEAKHGRDHLETLYQVANLGVNYRDAGRVKEAIPLLEEAHRASKKHRELIWVTDQLLATYTLTGETDKATGLLQETLTEARTALPKDSPQLAGQLAQTGLGLLGLKKWAEAEPILREALAIREKTQPDAWNTFNTRSMLGGALLGQKKYADAERLLLAGYEGMKAREKTIPQQGLVRVPEALDRLIELYAATNKPDEVKKWRAERAKYPAEPAPSPREKK